jgi:Uma2 family endonuclease
MSAMTALRKQAMSVDEFLAWAERQPGRWELLEGIPTAMSPERVVHGDVKYRLARALDVAIAKAKAPCRFVLDSAAVRIDQRSLYQPDAMVYCGEPVSGDTLEIPNPVVVFEALSPGNAMTETMPHLADKLQGYFRVASIQHYLIADPDKRIVIHHARGTGDVVGTRIVSEGVLRLEPPGIEITVADLFAEHHRMCSPSLAH